MAPTSLAQCFGGSGDASCFSGARMHVASATGAALTSAPVFNNNQLVLNSGPTVTLSWTAPTSGTATSYIIEASSAPGGPANLANFNTGNAQTTLVVPDVPAGTYYVRIRGFDSGGAGPPSNEVQLIVTSGASCPSAPLNLSVPSGTSSTVVLAWQVPASGTPTSYVIQAGSAPGAADLANLDTNSTALSLTAPGVGAGRYYVRVYAKASACAAPTFLGPSSNEVVLTVGGPAPSSGWSGQIICRVQISGPSSYHDDETQTWTISGPGQTSGGRTVYPTLWTATGAGGATGKSWTVNVSQVTDFTVTTIASTGIPGFDRTSVGIVVRGGYVGTATSFDYYEQDFPAFAASSATATSVTGTWSRPTVGGDSPQQPGGSVGTVSCSWSLILQ
jgi:hypothetical protein